MTAQAAHQSTPSWWKTGTCYQIWPASYKDSNGDGIGDIPGIIGTLDYLKDLGVDIIWLSPMYKSPQVDMGYDISDYQDIYEKYGTMNDMDQLISECKARNMRLILDLVINHTSDQHKWFQESRKSKDNPKADWYMWRDPKIVDGKREPPNNWRAIFGGSAWEWVEERQQYYLHLFVPEQPDLNWELSEVRHAIYQEAIAYWLDKGIDGFRVDTCNLYSKTPGLPDAPIALPEEKYQPAFKLFENGPRMHEWLQEQKRDCLDKYGDVLMVGECPGSDHDTVLKYVSKSRGELSCVFDFDVVDLGTNRNFGGKKHQSHRHSLPELKNALGKVQNLIMESDGDAWGTVFLENHDQGRSVSRFATDKPEYREKAAKVLALIMCSLTGSLYMYQGQEIGTYNHSKDWKIEDIRDVDSINAYNDVRDRYGNDPIWNAKAMKGLATVGRDNARLPVQWSAESGAGFTTGKPWIRCHDDYKNVNVADQLKRQDSPLKFWQQMLKTRRQYQGLTILGDFELHDVYDQDTMIFIKTKTGDKEGKEGVLLINANFSEEQMPVDMPSRFRERSRELLVSTEDGQDDKYLRPWEARAWLLK